MILPIGDEPNPRGTPWVNYALLALNVGVFLVVTLPLMLRPPDLNDPLTQAYLQALIEANPGIDPREIAVRVLGGMSAYDIFLLQWGYRPAQPGLASLFASMFLHGGWWHLLGNMLFLWIYGDNVEHRLGRLGYLVAYLGTGAAAALGYGLFAPPSAGHVPMVGASGAISGVLGFYFVWFPRNKVRLLVLLFPFFVFVWKVGARLVLGFYLVVENLLPFLLRPRGDSGGGVAYGAHIGGFVAGLLVAVAINLWTRFRCRRQAQGCDERPSDAEPRGSGAPSSAAVARLARDGQTGAAVRAYLALPAPERRQVPLPLVVELAEELTVAGQPDAALALYRQALEDHGRDPGVSRIFLGIGLILLHKGRPTAAYQYLLDALDADPPPEVEIPVREALAAIARMQKLPFRDRR